MRLRTPFIAAFTVGLTALIISYLLSLRFPAEPTDYLWYDSLQQLGELGRAKYRQSHRYGEYAQRAEHDSLHHLATLFRAMAYADNVQCNNCRRSLSRPRAAPLRAATYARASACSPKREV